MHPQLTSCGPIEALRRAHLRVPSARHPQLTSCGPIEARISARISAACGRIRSSRAAAPLKRFTVASTLVTSEASAAHELRPH